ncbi:MAG: ferredoxin [Ramlibacter sp.]|nr:ferredoxin [Ramlibacter sp.]
MPLRVERKSRIATDVFLFELVHGDGVALPPFTAGAHVTVLTPNGLTRRYSLCNAPAETGRYCLAVKRDPAGLGGSVSLVDGVHEGDLLPTSVPLSYFALDPQASSHLLIAGGIGITPLLAMVRELQRWQADFQLVYLARTPEATAFLDVVQTPELNGRVLLHHDHGDPARALNLDPWLAQRPAGAHLYCCGPRGLMHAVRDKTRAWPTGSVHFEDFGGTDAQELADDRPFTVMLAKSGKSVAVPGGVSILEALRRENIAVPSSCESGTCGSCRTGLLAGVAQHRDYVLDESEHDREIMICVSRAVSPVLELDL